MRAAVLTSLVLFGVPAGATEPEAPTGLRAAVVFVGVSNADEAQLRRDLEDHLTASRGPSLLGRAATETAIKALAPKAVLKASEAELATLRRELGVDGLVIVRRLGQDDREKLLVFQIRSVDPAGEVSIRVVPVPLGDKIVLVRSIEAMLPHQRVDVAEPPAPKPVPGAAT